MGCSGAWPQVFGRGAWIAPSLTAVAPKLETKASGSSASLKMRLKAMAICLCRGLYGPPIHCIGTLFMVNMGRQAARTQRVKGKPRSGIFSRETRDLRPYYCSRQSLSQGLHLKKQINIMGPSIKWYVYIKGRNTTKLTPDFILHRKKKKQYGPPFVHQSFLWNLFVIL